jgi:hypothetical protein
VNVKAAVPVAVLVGAVVVAKHVVVAVPIVSDFVDTKVVTAIAVAAVDAVVSVVDAVPLVMAAVPLH